MSNNFSVKVSVNPGLLANAVMRKGLYDAYVDKLLDAVEEFQNNSPRGATGDLAAEWDLQAPRKEACSFQINARIINNAPNSLFRIAGRVPGKLPPIEAIAPWAKMHGLNPFMVARGIAKRGTQRWRERENWVGIWTDGSLIPGGRLEQLQQEIISELGRKF
jgi:hypothetical protein